ncbi:ABC transporter ATP-binding protein [Synergistes jonesii]|uniref:Teichoic acid ABC transporter ATP-binding protein n=1 Tax=Synergistes jonesii TaxID=2754 RepID=A0A073IRH8_9BACT|nr:ABC transporter ATP-binding protein [Synergistes jonesii]KEJ92165.1 teichoic acid ABC transporter ATP-binding protein [Synergistes jonesii]OFB62470.1 teichoic acid ABC transporter ATP-binding protein [Synergistes jonesii]OFB63086.1 teichoic acid ABC transporter ATP-binding protein [Synergistes jonesii]OFB63955.1 teichoic acid ABC transporter ATP-binding protein [Synergistes jonesii]OFB67554.1 teichoic acid ABC transporter ATP-binding protein [Synergistes jonesii]
MEEKTMIEVRDAAVRFNLATEKIDNLKEYFVKLAKRELLFQEFFALDNVSLTVKKGESWGIIGRNGSGKSTLLKLICGILKPYRGTVKTYGQIAPLIELQAGFDGRLTARENIFLAGALLGHNKKFMEDHFDEITNFAEVQRFVDVPVKNFSSGMSARLGFALATVVRPEILIIDEVLAVGDKAFQKKCEARMQEMLKNNVTLLFVSHSCDAVRRMCQKALWLDSGKAVLSGDSETVCSAYEKS